MADSASTRWSRLRGWLTSSDGDEAGSDDEVGPDDVVTLPLGSYAPRALTIVAACRSQGLTVQHLDAGAAGYVTGAGDVHRLLVRGEDLALVRSIVADADGPLDPSIGDGA